MELLFEFLSAEGFDECFLECLSYGNCIAECKLHDFDPLNDLFDELPLTRWGLQQQRLVMPSCRKY
jgi:hypothetical protein